MRDIFRNRLRETRDRRRLTQRELADRLDALGYQDLDQAKLSRIEKGVRGVSVEEGIAIAAALNVSPVSLWSPRDEEPVMIGKRPVDASRYREWFRGAASLEEGGAALFEMFQELPISEIEAFARQYTRRDIPDINYALLSDDTKSNLVRHASDVAWEVHEGEAIRRRERKKQEEGSNG